MIGIRPPPVPSNPSATSVDVKQHERSSSGRHNSRMVLLVTTKHNNKKPGSSINLHTNILYILQNRTGDNSTRIFFIALCAFNPVSDKHQRKAVSKYGQEYDKTDTAHTLPSDMCTFLNHKVKCCVMLRDLFFYFVYRSLIAKNKQTKHQALFYF